MEYEYIERFKQLGFGMFIHFGLYSIIGKGEWYLSTGEMAKDDYEQLAKRFKVKGDWAVELVSTAKAAGCRYITFTARHHDGFSLFDTRGLSSYDSMACCGRDFVEELATECKRQGLKLFLYQTLLDWHNENYDKNFTAYIDYLVKGIEILCRNYGDIGGFWFDGKWDKSEADWQEDRLYGTIRKYLPEAIIVNNTGLEALGEIGHKEIDSVTFERGKPFVISGSDKPIAGEVCESVTDHWGYAEYDISHKSPKALLDLLLDCRKCGCNLLLNTGLVPDGGVNALDRELFFSLGKWITYNGGFIYNIKPCDVEAENADIFFDGEKYYAVIHDVPMASNVNVARLKATKIVTIKNRRLKSVRWLDNGKEVAFKDNSFSAEPFGYGTSMLARVAEMQFE